MSPAPTLARARRLLSRVNAWIEAVPGGYALRTGSDRRARIVLMIDEAVFRGLIESPGLRVRNRGGWMARPAQGGSSAAPPPGQPGLIEGQRAMVELDGRVVARRANLGQTAVDWLARRVGPDGRPWLTPAQQAAAARLALEAERALCGPSLTMRWDALPRDGASGGLAANASTPTAHALAAAARVEAALAACGRARGLVEQVCIRATALQAAEQTLGIRRRTGKALLREGLQALARYYRLA